MFMEGDSTRLYYIVSYVLNHLSLFLFFYKRVVCMFEIETPGDLNTKKVYYS